MTRIFKLIDEPSKVISSTTTKFFNVKVGQATRDQRYLQKALLYLGNRSRFFFATDNQGIEFCDRCRMEYNLRPKDFTIRQLLNYLRATVTVQELSENANQCL